ncbi:MAG TPA: protein BatD, partial [Dokdonella sp.]
GTLTIPGLSVRWWNTEADRAEVAELPPHTIRVLPAPGTAQGTAPPADATPAAAPAPPAASAREVAAPSTRSVPSLRLWRALAAIGFALWLITLAAWWRSRRATPPVAAAPPPAPRGDASGQRAAFLRACSLGEFAAAERALVAWARSERADVRNLGELAARLAADAQRDALAELQRVRYAGASAHGLGARLQQAFKGGLAWRESAPARAQVSALPALYPDHER